MHPFSCSLGFRVHQDKLDGYYFFFPENWLPVTVSLLASSSLLVLCTTSTSVCLWKSLCRTGLCMQTSGNDIFYRNPTNVNENLFVDVSSPSSSTFESVEDLGTPGQAAKKTLNQVRS